jgi:phosphoglycolate phosphatase-like HAD superfamily hydrolase
VLAAKCQPERVKELRDLNTQADYGYISNAEYARGVAAVLGWTVDDVSATFKQARVRNEPLIAYVKQLHTDGVPLALLSNVSSGTLDELFAPGELDDMFDAKIFIGTAAHFNTKCQNVFDVRKQCCKLSIVQHAYSCRRMNTRQPQ